MSTKNLRKTVKGINDCSTLRPDIALRFSKESILQPDQVSPYSNKKALFDCPEGHSWEARVATVSAGGSCVYCKGLAVLKGFNDLETKCPELMDSYSKNNNLKVSQVYYAGAKNLLWICSTCSGEWSAQARQRAAGTGCPYCSGAKLLKGFNDFETRFPEKSKLWGKSNSKEASEVMPFTNKRYFFNCEKHGEWKTSPNRISNEGGCPECSLNNFVSKGESELASSIEALGFTVKCSERKLLKGFEIDIFIPELNIGVEYNGTYWHSDKIILKTKNITALEYHQTKKDKATKAGIRLYYVWDDDWQNEKQMMMNAIENLLKFNEVNPKLEILSKG